MFILAFMCMKSSFPHLGKGDHRNRINVFLAGCPLNLRNIFDLHSLIRIMFDHFPLEKRDEVIPFLANDRKRSIAVR